MIVYGSKWELMGVNKSLWELIEAIASYWKIMMINGN
jgi:hypothetical protein